MSETNKKLKEYEPKKTYKGAAIGLLAMRALKGKGGKMSHKVALRVVAGDSTVDAERLSPEKRRTIEKLSQKTEYWHGTGRYQYRDGKKIDVLGGIIAQGGLLPHRDDIDLVGEMDSVSLARSRMYSRAYADMHEHGASGERHGSALLWSAAFIGPLALKMVHEGKVWRKENRQRMQEHFANSNSAQWYRKVRQEPTGTLGIFARGSDIEGNYPIVFGIKEGTVKPTETSQSVAVHEVRSTEPISFADITHIEVPETHVTDTQAMLLEAGYSTPVLAIEDFEAYATTQPFDKLVST